MSKPVQKVSEILSNMRIAAIEKGIPLPESFVDPTVKQPPKKESQLPEEKLDDEQEKTNEQDNSDDELPRPKEVTELPKKKKLFICNMCNEKFRTKQGILSHVGKRIPCWRDKDLVWLSENFSKGTIEQSIDKYEKRIENFEIISRKAKTVSDIDTCRKQIMLMKNDLEKIVAWLRVIAIERNDKDMFEEQISEYYVRMKNLTDKYKLLVIR